MVEGPRQPGRLHQPRGAQWLAGQLHRLLAADRVRDARRARREPVIGGFKTDDGESGNGPNTYIPADRAPTPTGARAWRCATATAWSTSKAVWSVLGAAGVLFARSGFIGSPAFPGHWAGDNEPNFGDNGLPGVIVAGQSAAMSGYADLGPRRRRLPGHEFQRVAARSVHALDPVRLFLADHADASAGRPSELQYPWRFGDQALANYQFFARLHTRLFPYIYTYAKEASTTGLPIIRPLVLVDPGRSQDVRRPAHAITSATSSSSLRCSRRTRRPRRLPPRGAVARLLDQRAARRRADGYLDQTRSGADAPLRARGRDRADASERDVRTLCDAAYVNDPQVSTDDGGLLVAVYPAGASDFTVFDGTRVQAQGAAPSGTVTITSTRRPMTLRILAAEPAGVSHNGAPLPRQPAAAGWGYDQATGFIEVSFTHSGGTESIAY